MNFVNFSHSPHNWSYPQPPLLMHCRVLNKTEHLICAVLSTYPPSLSCLLLWTKKIIIKIFAGYFVLIVYLPPTTTLRKDIWIFSYNEVVPCCKEITFMENNLWNANHFCLCCRQFFFSLAATSQILTHRKRLFFPLRINPSTMGYIITVIPLVKVNPAEVGIGILRYILSRF